MTFMKNSKYYRRQCDLYATRLGEWLNDNPGRKTKSRMAIATAYGALSAVKLNEEEAYEAMRAVDEIFVTAPDSAARVIHKATRQSEKFNEFWKGK